MKNFIYLCMYVFICLFTLNTLAQSAHDYYLLANEKAKNNDFKGAIELFNKSLELDSLSSDAFYNRGLSKLYLEDKYGALEDFNRSIKLKPDFVNALNNKGTTLIMLGEYKKAIEALILAITYDSNNSTGYLMLGQAQLKMGNVDDGCWNIHKAKELGNPKAESIINQACESYKPKNLVIESLKMDWPDSEGWKIANTQDNKAMKMIELLKNEESFDNWTEIGTVFCYKTLSASLKIPLTVGMDYIRANSKKLCPESKVTLIDKNDTCEYPWIIFKVECDRESPTESQIWFFIQGTYEQFHVFRAIKERSIPQEIQEKWVNFFKTFQIVKS